MRLALLSDIHGNLTALEAVLAELAHASVDQILCLGDVAIFGPQPSAALIRVHELGCPVVMGNTDAWALDPQPHPFRDEDTPNFNAIELWSAAQLSEAERALIRTFQPTIPVELGDGMNLLTYHGSPRSFHEAIVATTPGERLAEFFTGITAPILVGGHTHEQFMRRWQDRVVINPGSVGLPYERLADGRTRNPPWAEYALLSYEQGRLHVELRRTPVDVGRIEQAVRQSAMPNAEWWLAGWGR